ncbi:LysR family transcriptional regulator [Polyangium sp. y55x31]|uniref:LysR family transcriptional regulator n=1 Tax=Polyangium sp. y55x31 TaxID=3042688 RepID=UPI002482BB8D|nr:LysR family transcriptional regulator [Polyangium sp. y55x31]MDI1484607.1 LysR family transcriptional regulator [Polyangium sp. y55x31]
MHVVTRRPCKNPQPMNWDDLRFVAALSRAGSLAKTAAALGVDHTTVGRRIEAAERALGLRLFTRTAAGYVLTRDGERLLSPLRQVEDAVLALERGVHAQRGALEGTVRVTSPETFGITYLAPRLARFGRQYPALCVELLPAGAVLDLSRSEAELAVRFVRTSHESLRVRRVGEVRHGLYASSAYLTRHPIRTPNDLHEHPLLLPTSGVELAWLQHLSPGVRPAFVSDVSLALAEAAQADAGIAVLPRFLGDRTPGLTHVPMPREPGQPLWLTVHRDLRQTPRVRVLVDYLVATLRADRDLLRGD